MLRQKHPELSRPGLDLASELRFLAGQVPFEPVDVVEQLVHRRVAILDGFFQHPGNHSRQLLGDGGRQVPHGRRIGSEDSIEDFRQGRGRERLFSGEELVGERSQRKDVGARVGLPAQNLLGRHVVGRAHDLASRGQRRLRDVREPEVEELDLAVFGQKDVSGLHVPVNDAPAVRMGEAAAHFTQDAHLLLQGQVLARAKPLAQVLAAEELHDDVDTVLLLAQLENGDHVPVLEVGDEARFAEEALDRLLPLQAVDRLLLDRHLSFEHRVDRAVYDAGPSLPQLSQDGVLADVLHLLSRATTPSPPLGDWRRWLRTP